jgi:tetratricopeptide (TPR) repeat protein
LRHASVFLTGILFVSVSAFVILRSSAFVYAYEDARLVLDPSAERAHYYGIRHFDAHAASSYDVARAERMFKRALELDPSFPMVRHELARIAFLKSDFERALGLINKELDTNPDPSPSSYYVRALIKGFSKDYAGAAADYEKFFKIAPANWGAINDYAWVLMKAGLSDGALAALEWGLEEWPENPWLLNSMATALYEEGRYEEAREVASRAERAVETLTKSDWLDAYPGNDPLVADDGLQTFREAVAANKKMVETALEGRGVQ